MTRSATVVISLLVSGLLALAGPFGAAAATPRFTPEGYTTFQSQLAAHKLRAVTFNKKAHTLHITLDDGRHMLASYPSRQWRAIEQRIVATGVPVAIEKTHHTTGAVHHKLRYIAAGVLVVVVLVIIAVLAINRRRPPLEPLRSGDGAGDGDGGDRGDGVPSDPPTSAV